MIQFLKSKVKKAIFSLTKRFDHIKKGVNVNKNWYGNKYGGFFLCPDYVHENSIIYSFGIGEDISFDISVIQRHNCNVFGFDPTPKSTKWIDEHVDLPSQFKFFKFGIADKSGLTDFFLPKNPEHVSGSFINQSNVDKNKVVTVELKSLSDISIELGHAQIDVLKMDIEGAEYNVLESILKSPVKINQLLIEFHERFFEDGKQKTVTSIELLKKNGYEIFAFSDSFEEISFIRREII